MLYPHFYLVIKPSFYVFFHKKMAMAMFITSFWLSVSTFMVTLLRLVLNYIFRFWIDDTSQKKKNFISPEVYDDQMVSNCDDSMPELEVADDEEYEYDGLFGNKELSPKFSFKFQFQSFDDTKSSNEEFAGSSTSKYEFLPKKDFSGYIEEPEVVSFSVKELFLNSDEGSVDDKEIFNDGFLLEKDFLVDKDDFGEEVVNNSYSGDDIEKPESITLSEVPLFEKEQSINSDSSLPEKEEFGDEGRFISENELVSSDSEPESISLWDKFSVMVSTMDSDSDAFLSDEDFDGRVELESEPTEEFGDSKVETETMGDIRNSEEMHFEARRILDPGGTEMSSPTSPVHILERHESTDLDEILEMMDDIEKLENFNLPHSGRMDTNDQIEREFNEIQAECEQEDMGRAEASVNCEILEESYLQDSSSSESGESSSLETLWEHQDLIEQLKMEIRKVRATGLPTILEESESPRMSEDLKPWKIDEKIVHEDQMKGLRKFYKSYKERMRKLDILNYQKMYAIGFLKLKDPLQSMSTQKSFGPNLISLLSQNFLLPKRRRPEVDSSVTFMRELESDLELVYVGHLCLSWEFLHWQYLKARELLESDPYEIRPYNQVAVEFQQFQVYMQRFLEYEPFQGPRVQNYVKNRCVMRTLLEVPVIKEDPVDKEGRKRSKDAITCSMLLKVLEDSMQIFWEFVKADKNDDNVIFKGLSRPQAKFLDPADTALLAVVQTNLQKKEKKLKDILRSGNCLVKRFQKQPKEHSEQLLFFPQVDLKLVSRVLRMSKITSDQLAWCHKKLDRISFVQRKIHLEPSFLLFPC